MKIVFFIKTIINIRSIEVRIVVLRVIGTLICRIVGTGGRDSDASCCFNQ